MKNYIKIFMKDVGIKTNEKFRILSRSRPNGYWDNGSIYWFNDKYELMYADEHLCERNRTYWFSERNGGFYLYDLLTGNFHDIIKS